MCVPAQDMEQLQCKEADWSWTVDELGMLMVPRHAWSHSVLSVQTPHPHSVMNLTLPFFSPHYCTKMVLPLTTAIFDKRHFISLVKITVG